MRKFYSGILSLLLVLSAIVVQAQSITNYNFAASSGTFTPLVGGTSVATSTSVADFLGDTRTSTEIPLGFTFYYMGVPYTSVVAMSDGFLSFNTSATSAAGNNLATSTAARRPLVAPLWDDLDGASGTGSASYLTTGAAGSRVFTIEWLNWQWNWSATGATISFQVRLYEATGAVEFIYRSEAGAVNSGTASIGITAAGTGAGNYLSLDGTTASPAVSSTTETTNISAKPADGQTYTFTPVSATTPAVPSGLTFNAVTHSSADITWTDNSTNETYFKVYRSTDNVTFTLVSTVASTTVAGTGTTYTYAATGMLPSTQYYWRIESGNEGSAMSAPVAGNMTTAPGTLIGNKTVGAGGDYPNLTTAFADIRNSGLAGNIVLQLIAGYPASPETYPILTSNNVVLNYNVTVYPTVAGLSITSSSTTGTLLLDNATNITFDGRVNATGTTKNLIISNTSTSGYAIRFVNDAVNNTIRYANISGVATGTTNGVITFGSTTGTTGNDNNTIDNVDIRDGATTPTNGIYASGSSTLTNDNNTVSNSNIFNFWSAGSASNGILLSTGSNAWTITGNHFYQSVGRTSTGSNLHTGINISNSSGNNFTVTNNFVGGTAPSAAGSAWTFTNITFGNRFNGIVVSAGSVTPSTITGNTVKNVLLNTNSTTVGNFTGILGSAGALNISNNNIGDQTITSIAVNVAATGSATNLISYTGSSAFTISNNMLGGVFATGTTASNGVSINGIYVTGGTPTITNNTIGGTAASSMEAVTVVAGTVTQYVMGIQVTTATGSATITGNTIRNLTQNGTTTSTGAGVRGISYAGTATATISNNTISSLAGATGHASLAGGAVGVLGILHTGTAPGGATITDNVIFTLRNTNPGTVQSNVAGIAFSNPTGGTIDGNRIYDLRNASTRTTAATPPTAIGILLRAAVGGVPMVSNNMISLGDGQTTNTQFIGIMNSFSTFGFSIYHNSIVISGTAASGAWPSFAFLRGDNSGTAITTPVDIKNNIFVNTRSGGTGAHYAIANQSTAVNAAGFISNYNVLNTANAATVGLWGSTDMTFANWKSTTSQDMQSYSGIPVTFTNIATADLHITIGGATPIESGGVPGLNVSVDYDDQTRAGYAGYVGTGTAPDLGADEFSGVQASPTISNLVVTPSTLQCTATARNISVNVTPGSAAVTSVMLYYSYNGVAQPAVAMTNAGATWSGTIPAATPANATVTYYIIATDANGFSSTLSGTPYADAPYTGVNFTATASESTICVGESVNLTSELNRITTVTSGAGSTTSTSAGATPFYHGWGGQKSQYIFTRSELNALGLVGGNINDLSIDISTLGTPVLEGFSISMAHTTQSTFGSNNAITPVTQVYSGPGASNGQTLVAGINKFVFNTPFNWDGVSNVVVQFCYSNNNTGGTTSAVRVDPQPVVTTFYVYADNQSVATICGALTTIPASGSSGTLSTRPKMIFTEDSAPASTFSWSDGTGTVSTSQNITVSPTTTTTYTITAQNSNGCQISATPVTITVLSVPTAPAGTNSIQCGTGVPTASVSGTGTMKWYDAATGGTLLQSGGNTFTGSISATTTFYVAADNGACEGPRTAVTASVNAPDAIVASRNTNNICPNAPVQLTATNSGTNNVYVYTWTASPVAGSGIPTSVTGSPVTINPTAAGTYVYTVTGSEASTGCATTATVSVTVIEPPVINPITASAETICSGSSTTLTATTPVVGPGTATVGTGTVRNVANSTTASGYPAPFGNYYYGAKNQMLITAAELTAAGLRAGDITSIAFDVVTPETEPLIDFSIGIKTTALSSLGAMETGFTVVYTDPAYSPSPSPGYAANTITFNTPFNWDGVSNLIIETCFNNTDFVLSAVFNQSTTSYVSTRVYRADASGVCASTSTTFSYSQRPNIQFGGIALNDGASNFTWLWNPGAIPGNVATVSPTTTTTYTVTATNPATGCSNTASKTITVTSVSATASSNAGGTVCKGTSVQLTATPVGGAPFTYSWSDGTTVVGTTQTVTVSPTATTTYTATVTDACGNNTTATVIVTVNNPAVTATAPGSRCGIGTVTLGATGEPGASLNWYAAATGGAPLGTGASFITPSLNTTTTYYVGAVNGSSNNNTGRLAPQAGAGTNLTTYGQDFTITMATNLNSVDVISTTGSSITISLYSANGAAQLQTTGAVAVTPASTTTVPLNWALAPGTYRLVANGMTGDFIRENSTVTYPISLGGVGQINGFVSSITGTVTTSASYYFMYNWNMLIPCEGDRVAVTATVNTPPDVDITGNAAICSGQSTTLTATSANTGYTYSWSPGSLSGNSVSVSPTATTKYYVTATDASGGPNDGCVTIDSFTVTVNPLPTAPVITGITTICNGQSTQLTAESVYGIPTIRLTELTLFRTGTGQTPTYPATVGTGDDLIEISNLYGQPINVSGMQVEIWSGTAVNRTWTAPAGTIIPGNGVLVLHSGTGTDNAGNLFFNTGGSSDFFSSGSAIGVLIKYQGEMIDAVASNGYTWPAASGVTAAEWTGNIPGSSGFAGVSRTAPADNNDAGDWTISSTAAPQTVGTYNPGLDPVTPPTLNYVWSPATGLSSTTIANPIANPTSAQTYTVTVTEPVTGCTNTGVVSITVNELPVITTQPRDTIFCAGGNATFTVAATGTAITYQWRKDGVDIPGATTPTLMVNNATAADAGTYTVVVSGACAPAAISTGAVLALYAQPDITTQPVAQSACVGTAATFSVATSAHGAMFQWRKNGVDIGGATSATYTIPSVVLADAGNYDVVVSGTCSPSVTSVAVALTVDEAPVITSDPSGVTLCAGNPASFSVTATGAGLTYQWKLNGVDVPGATSSTYNIASASVSDAGNYTVVVSGTCSPSVTSATAVLVVNTAPAITTQPLTQTVCAGQNVTFNVVATGAALTYQWKKNGVDIGGATASSYTITGATSADAANYTVEISGTCTPPVTSNVAALTVDQAPVIGTQPVSQTVCSGTNVTFSIAATGVGLTYQWYRNGTVAISGATTDTYTITGATAANVGQYHVVVNSSCGTTVTSATATLAVNTPPAITVQPASQTACLASSVTFNVTATGSGLTYQWKKNGTDIGGATSSTLTINNVSAADLGAYTVVVTGICGSPVTSNAANLAVSATNTWLGVANSDWNNASNWCAGVPTSTSVILIPSSTPFSAVLLGNGAVRDVTISTGATLTIGAGGNLNLHGNMVNSGTVTASAGTLSLMGATAQTIPALTVGHVVMNGTGGVDLGGTLTIANSLTLTNGHITLGSNNLILPGGTLGTVASHIITNGTGVVTSNNINAASVIFPVGPDAASYNPVMISSGGGRNYSVRVATGITPTIANPARAINRTWNVSVNTAPAAAATITFGYADAHANASVVPSANMEVGRHTGTAWQVITPAGGVAPFGTAALRTVSSQSTAFGPMVVANVGGILTPTSLPDIDADITSAVLMPNAFETSTVLRLTALRTMNIDWTIRDAQGKVVMRFSRNVSAGQNDIPLWLRHLANGTYYMVGETEKGRTEVLRFIRL